MLTLQEGVLRRREDADNDFKEGQAVASQKVTIEVEIFNERH
jgi:hypothetical protein